MRVPRDKGIDHSPNRSHHDLVGGNAMHDLVYLIRQRDVSEKNQKQN